MTRINAHGYLSFIIAGLTLCSAVNAQTAAPPPPNPQGLYSREAAERANLEKLAEFMDQRSVEKRTDLVAPKIAKTRVAKALEALKAHCEVTDAVHLSEVFGTRWGGNVSAGLYEAACKNGSGYLVTIRSTHETSAIPCFALEGQANESSIAHCSLPGNAKPNEHAQSMLESLGIKCMVDSSKWLGESQKASSDYIETHCATGEGYVLNIPLLGSGGAAGVKTCKESAATGIPCSLLPSEPSVVDARPDIAWFKEQLKKAGVACEVLQARIVGREKIRRRYVTEFECKDLPEGVVAFVPPEGGDPAGFESMTCSAAASKHITCQFPQGQASATK